MNGIVVFVHCVLFSTSFENLHVMFSYCNCSVAWWHFNFWMHKQGSVTTEKKMDSVTVLSNSLDKWVEECSVSLNSAEQFWNRYISLCNSKILKFLRLLYGNGILFHLICGAGSDFKPNSLHASNKKRKVSICLVPIQKFLLHDNCNRVSEASLDWVVKAPRGSQLKFTFSYCRQTEDILTWRLWVLGLW